MYVALKWSFSEEDWKQFNKKISKITYKNKCVNGHENTSESLFCNKCGLKLKQNNNILEDLRLKTYFNDDDEPYVMLFKLISKETILDDEIEKYIGRVFNKIEEELLNDLGDVSKLLCDYGGGSVNRLYENLVIIDEKILED